MTEASAPGGTHRPVLEARALTKTFAGVKALDSVDLTIAGGEIHALLGENGSGKSTLIKILSGYHQADAGSEVRIAGQLMHLGSPDSAYSLGCRFVHQDLGLVDSSSILDNLLLNTGFPSRWGTIRGRHARREAQADLARVGLGHLDPRVAVGTLTPAMKTGVAVARALRADPRSPVALLVLDEPTATLPESEVRELLDIVRQVASNDVGVLYVTHRLDEVFQVTHNVTVLRDGRQVATRPIEALDRAGLINLLVGRELEEIHAAAENVHAERGAPILDVVDLHAGSVRGVSFQIQPGEIVGIAGITGSGRETVLAALFGALPREQGVVALKGARLSKQRPDTSMKAGMAYLPPDRKTLGGIMNLSARENLTVADLRPFWRSLTLRRTAERAEARMWFERLNVRPAGAWEKPLMTFSGGNQQKILFGKWLRREPSVFLLDEPTQGVDVGAKAALHRQLIRTAQEGAAVVVSSSDVDELAALCQRVLVLRAGKLVKELRDPNVTVAIISRECLGGDDAGVAA